MHSGDRKHSMQTAQHRGPSCARSFPAQTPSALPGLWMPTPSADNCGHGLNFGLVASWRQPLWLGSLLQAADPLRAAPVRCQGQRLQTDICPSALGPPARRWKPPEDRGWVWPYAVFPGAGPGLAAHRHSLKTWEQTIYLTPPFLPGSHSQSTGV